MDTQSSGAAEKNSESFMRGNAAPQAGSKLESSFYGARRGDTDSVASSPILGSATSLGRFADFAPLLLADTWKASGKKTVSNLMQNEKLNLKNSFSWVDLGQGPRHFNNKPHHQNYNAKNTVEEILDISHLSTHEAEQDALSEILNRSHLQFDSAKGALEENTSLQSFANGRSRSSSISSVCSDASLDWDDSEQELSFFKGAFEENDEEELDLGAEPLFKDSVAPADLEPFADLDFVGITSTKGGASTHYMDWGTGDLSDSEDESCPVIRKSSTVDHAFDWDDSVFNEVYGESDEEELDLGAEPLFKDSVAPADLKPLEKLSAEEKISFQRLRSTQGAVPAGYMILCYVEEKDFLKTKPRRHSISSPQSDFPPKTVSRHFKEPDFL
ncbi:MAG: hypothetical protein ACRCYZ_01785 [Alphaproteobacteria bacterium]